ncbi:hypothetical protein AB1I63_09505 [Streptococcus pneumoniae]
MKEIHETKCGTKEQWLENREVLQEEIVERQAQIQQLKQQIQSMTRLIEQLNEKLAEKGIT